MGGEVAENFHHPIAYVYTTKKKQVFLPPSQGLSLQKNSMIVGRDQSNWPPVPPLLSWKFKGAPPNGAQEISGLSRGVLRDNDGEKNPIRFP